MVTPPQKRHDGLLLALIGMPACGKTEATYILNETYGFDSYRLSTVVRDELNARNVSNTYTHLEDVARDLRTQFGEDVIIRRAATQLESMESQYICIDGVRSLSEVAALRTLSPGVITLAVHASPALRLQRTLAVPPQISLEEFQFRDKSNLALGLGNAIAMADFLVVHNDNSRSGFRRDLSRTLRQICLSTNRVLPSRVNTLKRG